MAELSSLTPKGLKSFTEFWPYYVLEHEHRVNRYLHVVGLFLVFGVFAWSVNSGHYLLLLLCPVAGYGLAWVGHFFLQKNRPATFTYPVWSLMGDFKMFFYSLAGKMPNEISAAKTKVAASN